MRVCVGSLFASVASLCLAAIVPASAQDAAAFYKSHKLTLGAPSNAGGGYDTYMRALSRHVGRYIPGEPTIVVQNVPAAGGMALANQLYNTAPKDGTYIGMVRGTVVQEEIYKDPQVHFEGRKFIWIGNMNSDYDACVIWTGSSVTSIKDFYTREIVVGASGAGAAEPCCGFTEVEVMDSLLPSSCVQDSCVRADSARRMGARLRGQREPEARAVKDDPCSP